MKRSLYLFLSMIMGYALLAQPLGDRQVNLSIVNENKAVLSNATVSVMAVDSSVVRNLVTDQGGLASFKNLSPSSYIIRISMTGYETVFVNADVTAADVFVRTIVLKVKSGLLADVVVTAKKPFVQFLPDKTVINVEASITSAGATVMEVLEKSPGITVDRSGNISMKGRPSVMIMIDGKMTQLSGMDLQNLLSGMSASQIDVIELIENPGAKYDAGGNAGIINIKTKKNKQKGFNGSASTSYGQGRYPKNNNSLILNYRSGPLNFFMTYSSNFNKNLLDMYALRTYHNPDGTVRSLLQQPYYTGTRNRVHTIRTGVDYFLDKKTTIGAAFTGTSLYRSSHSTSQIEWKKPSGVTDSTISTVGIRNTKLEQAGLNLNGRHVINEHRELSADVDFIKYRIRNQQYFENQLLMPGSVAEASSGDIPSTLNIFSAKLDYSHRLKKNLLWEAGLKTGRVVTDNLASYYFRNPWNVWEDDLGKSNHFLYTENIHAVYSSLDNKAGKWHWQTGLRYENTNYKARQLGNSVVKDSSFNRNYHSLFPTAFVTYDADSSNSFTFRAGRRIDRPAFNKLNPFVFILNKYTLQKGNPFYKPQYTWNFEISHLYKQVLSTSLTYNLTKDYFSQIFLADTANGTIIYTEGNIGKLQNFGASMSLQLSPKTWWSFTAQANYNHKIIEGVLWKVYKTNIDQLNLGMNNQFRFKERLGC